MAQKPSICIRTDGSGSIGVGHVMRCLTLADRLKAVDCLVDFISKDFDQQIHDMVLAKGYRLHLIPIETPAVADFNTAFDVGTTKKILKRCGKKPDWLIIDHYSIGKEWQTGIRPFVRRIMVIDDFFDRHHDCDLYLNQNHTFDENPAVAYLPPHCFTFIGPEYAILRDEFKMEKRSRDGRVGKIFVFFGGSDPTNETDKVLEAIKLLRQDDLTFLVVVGAANSNKNEIKAKCSQIESVKFYCQVSNIAAIMNESDLAICAGGSNSWERCLMSLPSIIITVAENQIDIAAAIDALGAGIYLGQNEDIDSSKVAAMLQVLLKSPLKLRHMAAACEAIEVGSRFDSIIEAIQFN